MILGEKQSLRARTRGFLTGLDAGLKQEASRKILAQLEDWHPWRIARTVCAFSPLSTEPDIFDPWPSGKKIILPRVTQYGLSLHFIENLDELVEGSFGILEPSSEAPQAPPRADLILVPGLAFDRFGMRLGRGGGYYDRLLADFEGLRVGICFEGVIFDRIPFESHDQRVDFLASPAGIISCGVRNRFADPGE